MKTNQSRAHTLITQADDLRERGKLDEAIATYREVIRLVPAFGTLNLVVGDMLFKLQRPAEAADAYRTVLDIVPEHDQAWSSLGQCQLMLGQYADALVSLEKAVQLNANDVEANYYLAMLYARQNETKKAVGCLRQALQLRPQWESQARNDKILVALVDDALSVKKSWQFWKR